MEYRQIEIPETLLRIRAEPLPPNPETATQAAVSDFMLDLRAWGKAIEAENAALKEIIHAFNAQSKRAGSSK